MSLGTHCTTVETVDVGWCSNITDDGALKISETCSTLRYLGMTRCDRVTVPTLEYLVEKYPHVHYSTFLLDARRLLDKARRLGYLGPEDVVEGPGNRNQQTDDAYPGANCPSK